VINVSSGTVFVSSSHRRAFIANKVRTKKSLGVVEMLAFTLNQSRSSTKGNYTAGQGPSIDGSVESRTSDASSSLGKRLQLSKEHPRRPQSKCSLMNSFAPSYEDLTKETKEVL